MISFYTVVTLSRGIHPPTGNRQSWVICPRDAKERITGVKNPWVHHLFDILSRNIGECLPEVICLRISIKEPTKVEPQAIPHLFRANKRSEHSYHCGPLGIGDDIKNPLKVTRLTDGDMDRVRSRKCINSECGHEVSCSITLPSFPLWVKIVRW